MYAGREEESMDWAREIQQALSRPPFDGIPPEKWDHSPNHEQEEDALTNQDLLEQIQEQFDLFDQESAKGTKGNQSAMMRSRTVSNKITALLKEWRKQTIEASKA
jgi:hypothetical protein